MPVCRRALTIPMSDPTRPRKGSRASQERSLTLKVPRQTRLRATPLTPPIHSPSEVIVSLQTSGRLAERSCRFHWRLNPHNHHMRVFRHGAIPADVGVHASVIASLICLEHAINSLYAT